MNQRHLDVVEFDAFDLHLGVQSVFSR